MTQYLKQYGIKAAVVTGETPNQKEIRYLQTLSLVRSTPYVMLAF